MPIVCINLDAAAGIFATASTHFPRQVGDPLIIMLEWISKGQSRCQHSSLIILQMLTHPREGDHPDARQVRAMLPLESRSAFTFPLLRPCNTARHIVLFQFYWRAMSHAGCV